jgi:ParB family chromosome partitioning protein
MLEGKNPKTIEEIKQDPNVKAAIPEMQNALGTKVRIHEGARGKGRIEIDYYSQDDLDRIYELIVRA